MQALGRCGRWARVGGHLHGDLQVCAGGAAALGHLQQVSGGTWKRKSLALPYQL